MLGEGLLPVTIDNKGVVRKANTSEEWYSYEKKNWANAVILENEETTYNAGDVIPESNIESYFVWIPRYRYKLFDLGEYSKLGTLDLTKPKLINIVFETKGQETKDTNNGECTTPMTSGESGNCKVGDYMTHPAFISMNTNGLWVGKFESGYKGATSKTEAVKNNKDTNNLQIKPNLYTWRGITIGNAFNVGYNYKRELDSHMMKNTEWGSVAYLSHSVYGSAKRVRVNNNSEFITGYAATEEPTKNYSNTSVEGNRFESTELGKDGTYTIGYFNPSSIVASTTGNYSGIYDMSGGVWEYVMAHTNNEVSNDQSTLTSTFFENTKWNNYYDLYSSKINSDFNKRILGDATGELGPFENTLDLDNVNRFKSSWYGNAGFAISSTNSWGVRGAAMNDGLVAGVFAFSSMHGGNLPAFGFRVVLSL